MVVDLPMTCGGGTRASSRAQLHKMVTPWARRTREDGAMAAAGSPLDPSPPSPFCICGLVAEPAPLASPITCGISRSPAQPSLRAFVVSHRIASAASASTAAMPPLAAADAFLVLEFIAGNRRIPNAVFAALLASLPSSSTSRHTSPRLRRALVLRALDAALHAEGASCSFTLLLRKVRRVLADPDASASFPHQLSVADHEGNDGARAAAAVSDLKRLLNHEWANLPPSKIELAADRLAGDGSLQTWAAADHTKRTKLRLLVGESTEREILAKLMQDASDSHTPIPPGVADNARNANEPDGALRNDEADPSKQNDEADRAQEGMAGHQNASVKGTQGVLLSEKYVSASNKRSLMERHPNASSYEWDGLGDSDDDRPVGKRVLPPFKRKPNLSPACAHKIRKKWSEVEEKTLLEGVEKYGKGNWKDIKVAYPDVFEERSTVDLKDKFRNMERHHESA